MTSKFKFIMLIDDDIPTNYLSELVIMQSDSCEKVQSFINAENALDFLQDNIQTKELPDLILLDINMPGMNGWEFLEVYKNIKFLEENTPIICMITTSLNPDDERKASKIEVLSGFFLKPFSLEILQGIQDSLRAKFLNQYKGNNQNIKL